MNYYSTGCQAPGKTLGTQDLTTAETTKTVTIYHQHQGRRKRTESKQNEASLGPIDVDEENDTEDDIEDELVGWLLVGFYFTSHISSNGMTTQ